MMAMPKSSTEMRATSNGPKPSVHRGWRAWLSTAFVVLATIAVMGLGVVALIKSGVDVLKVQSALSSVRLYGVVVQSAIVALIGLRWHALVRWGQRRGIVQAHEFDRVIALRSKAMVFLCAYLILIPIGPQMLFKLLGMG